MNNNSAVLVVSSDEFPMQVTTHGDLQPDDAAGLILGRYAVTKRWLFWKKTASRPLILPDKDVMRHIAVYGGSGYGVNIWLVDLAAQKMRSGWSAWFVDFFGDQRTAQEISAAAEDNAIPLSIMDSRLIRAADVSSMLKVGRMAAYVHLDSMAADCLPAQTSNVIEIIHQAISERLNSVTVDDLHPVLMVFNGFPQCNETMPLITNMLAQCRSAKIGLVLRFHEYRADIKWQQAVDENTYTCVNFNDDMRDLS